MKICSCVYDVKVFGCLASHACGARNNLHRPDDFGFRWKVSNWTITYFHDKTGNSVVNVTFQIFDTVNKALMYLKAKAAKDRNDKDCQIDLLNTVIDAGKFLKGMQGNFVLRGHIQNLLKSVNFDPKFPLPAVSTYLNFKYNELVEKKILHWQQGTYRLTNISFVTDLIPIDARGFVDYRIVAKFSKNPKVSVFVASFRFFGGFRRI